jgi:adenylate kinase family enzyme
MNEDLKRIMIIGRPGSGKSTFAIDLHKKLNIPLFHLDKHFFIENWEQRDYQAFLSIQQSFVDEPRWIIDGNSTKSYEMRYSQADICLYFNFPRYLCYWRVFKRLFHKNPHIDDRALNCQETVRWSLLTYMWSFEKRVSNLLADLKTKYPHVQFVELQCDKDILQFMRTL